MNKLITSVLVALSVTGFSKAAMAAPLNTALPEVWNVNFSASSPVFQGAGVVWGPDNPSTNSWNFYYDATPLGGNISAGGQAYDTRWPLDPVYSGQINYEANTQSNITSGSAGIPGYITSTYNGIDGTPITAIFDASTVPGVGGVYKGWVYIYTLHGEQSPDFVGSTSFYSAFHGTTVTTTLTFSGSTTWSDGHGNNYDVYAYDTVTDHPGIVAFKSFSEGQVSGMQLAPAPEPGTIVLLGIGALAGGLMKRRKYSE